MNKSDVDSIVIHCSETMEGKDFKAADIDRWHKEKGWKMIGYHYVIDLDGTVEVGRPLSMEGAHCNTAGTSGKSYNKHSIGICYIGGLGKDGKVKDTRTPQQKKAMKELVEKLRREFNIKDVLGHRDASEDKNHDGKITQNEWHKMCPSFDVRPEFPIV